MSFISVYLAWQENTSWASSCHRLYLLSPVLIEELQLQLEKTKYSQSYWQSYKLLSLMHNLEANDTLIKFLFSSKRYLSLVLFFLIRLQCL